jgi:hypothetical protein
MLQLLLNAGDVNFAPPWILWGTTDSGLYASYVEPPCLAINSVCHAHGNILTTCFSQVLAGLGERLSPLTTHKSVQHISKNFALALMSTNLQQTPLNSLKFVTSLIMISIFVVQNDITKIKAHCEAEQVAKNKHNFDFVEAHCKLLRPPLKVWE